MSVEVVEMILKHGLRVRHLQNFERNSIFAGRIETVKEVGLHPRGVVWMLDEKMVEIRVLANPFLHQTPVPILN